jgi:hypothetical protein
VDSALSDFQPAWAVVLRDVETIADEERDVVTVLRVFWSKEAAIAEVRRLRDADPSDDHLYYCDATSVARRE